MSQQKEKNPDVQNTCNSSLQQRSSRLCNLVLSRLSGRAYRFNVPRMGQLLLVWQGGAFDKKEITLPFGIIGGDIVHQMGSSWFNLEKNAIIPVGMQLVDRRDLWKTQL